MPPPAHSSYMIILGSKSRSRRQILAGMGYEFNIMTADINEKAIRKDNPEELVMALAEAKADAIISKLQTNISKEDAEPVLLITVDTVVVHGGAIRKPGNSLKVIQGAIPLPWHLYLRPTFKQVVENEHATKLRYTSMRYWMKSSIIYEGVMLNVAGGLLVEHPLV